MIKWTYFYASSYIKQNIFHVFKFNEHILKDKKDAPFIHLLNKSIYISPIFLKFYKFI